MGSDHRIVTAKVRLSLRQSKSSIKKKIRYDWNLLLTDNNIKDRYTAEVRNPYQALPDLEGNEDANRVYEDIMKAHKVAVKSKIPVRTKLKQRVPWEDDNRLIRKT